MLFRRTGAMLLAVVVAAAAGCGDTDDDAASAATDVEAESTATVDDTAEPTGEGTRQADGSQTDTTSDQQEQAGTASDAAEEPASDAAAGTEDNPLAVGEKATVGSYDVTLVEFQADATDAVVAANEFNEPPSNGAYGLVTLEATYQGDEDGQPGFDLTAALSGSDAVQYPDTDCSATVPGDGGIDAPTLEPGGTASFTFCLDYPLESVDGGTLFVEETVAFEDTAAYWDPATA